MVQRGEIGTQSRACWRAESAESGKKQEETVGVLGEKYRKKMPKAGAPSLAPYPVSIVVASVAVEVVLRCQDRARGLG